MRVGAMAKEVPPSKILKKTRHYLRV